MANYLKLYEQGFVDTVEFEQRGFYQNQMLIFEYKGASTPGPRIVLVLDEYPIGKIHCLKLNGIHPDKLASSFKRMVSRRLVEDYGKAIQYSVYDERLRLNEYRLPLVRMNDARGYYSSYVKKTADVSKTGIYRTYFRNKLIRPKIVVPNLQYFKFISMYFKPIDISDPERMRYLETKQEPDDFRDRFTDQDAQFD